MTDAFREFSKGYLRQKMGEARHLARSIDLHYEELATLEPELREIKAEIETFCQESGLTEADVMPPAQVQVVGYAALYKGFVPQPGRWGTDSGAVEYSERAASLFKAGTIDGSEAPTVGAEPESSYTDW